MLHKEILGLSLLAFIVWIVMATSPTNRMEHACSPVGWVGNVSVSLIALAVPAYQYDVQKWFNKGEYGCQYMLWRLFYQKEYNAYLASQSKSKEESTTVKKETAPIKDNGKETAK